MASSLLRVMAIALLLQLLAVTGTLALGFRGAADGIEQQTSDNARTSRALLQIPAIPNNISIPGVTIPPNTTLQNVTAANVTAAQGYNLSSINQTLILSQLNVPANLTALLGQNLTNDFVKRMVNQTLPMVLACSSNTTSQLLVCFKTWEAVFNKSYPNATEEQYRFTVFVNNTKTIVNQEIVLIKYFTTANKTQIVQLFLADQLPANLSTLLNNTALLGFNELNDRTVAELGRRFSGLLPDDVPGNSTNVTFTGTNSTALGARRKLLANGKSNWISYADDIRNQKQCGFCWVFSVTGSLEIINNIVAKSVKYAFSEQEIIDCLGAQCDPGGNAQWSSWVPKNKAWATQSADPYKMSTGSKAACPSGSPGNWFNDLVKCPYNWNDWKKILDVQPTLFYVYADNNFQNYQGNQIIAWQCSSSTSNHVMVAVGYDTYTSSSGDVYEYIIFRNSWGNNWGASGYGKWAMTKNGKDLNSCATSSKLHFHTNAGIPVPSLSGSCQTLPLTNQINQS